MSERSLSRGIFNADFMREIVAKHNAGENHDERLWFLINFEIWQRRFIDGEVTFEKDLKLKIPFQLLFRRKIRSI